MKKSKQRPKAKLKKYPNGGKKLNPYIATDPNDPRIQMYSDSTRLNTSSDILFSGYKNDKIDADFQAKQAKNWDNSSDPNMKAYARLKKANPSYKEDYSARPLLTKNSIPTDRTYIEHFPAPKQEVIYQPKSVVSTPKPAPIAAPIASFKTDLPQTVTYGKSPMGQPYSQTGSNKTWLTQSEADKIPALQYRMGGYKLPRFDTAGTMGPVEDTQNAAGYADTSDYSAADPNRKKSDSNNYSQYAQYAQYAQLAANAGMQYNQIQDSNAGEYTKNQQTADLAGDTVTQGMGSVSPYIAAGTGLRTSATEAVGDDTSAAKTASNWMAAPHEAAADDMAAYDAAETDTQKVGSALATVGDITGTTKGRQMFSYGLGKDKETTGAWGLYNDLSGISSRNNQAANVESEKKSAEAAQLAAKQKQQDAYKAQQQASFDSMMNAYGQQGQPQNAADPNRTSAYAAYGGIKYSQGGVSSGTPNAEVETIETMNTAPGSITAANGNTHAMGGVEVNLPTGTKMLSDRIKNPETGNTFAKDGNRYTTDKEDKVKDDINATGIAKFTANLKSQTKQFMHDKLFQAQESLKQMKVQKYAEKMGVKLSQSNSQTQQFPNGGTKGKELHYPNANGPEWQKAFGYDHIDTSGLSKNPYYPDYSKGPIVTNEIQVDQVLQTLKYQNYINALNQRNKDRDQVKGVEAINSLKYPNGGTKLPQYWDAGLTPMEVPEDPQLRSQETFDQYQDQVEWNRLDAAGKDGIPQEEPESSSMMNEYRSSNPNLYSKYPGAKSPEEGNSNTSDIVGMGANILGQNAGNIRDLWMTRMGKKYDKENSRKPNYNRLDDTQALQDADIQNKITRGALASAANGHAGSYMKNAIEAGGKNAEHKFRVRAEVDKYNAAIADKELGETLGLERQDKANEQANKARSEDIARKAVRGGGENTTAAITDYRRGKMDQKSLDLIASAYPDYYYDKKKNGWYHKSTNKKLEATA